MAKSLPLADELPHLWRSQDGRYTVEVRPDCLSAMVCMAIDNLPNEVGTALFGSYSHQGYCATVIGLAPLSADSKGTPHGFLRGIKGIGRFFATLFRRFRGKRHYVGEWHSHPNGQPWPSSTDDKNQTAICADLDTDCRECILILVGGNLRRKPLFGVFVYSRASGRIDLFPQRSNILRASS